MTPADIPKLAARNLVLVTFTKKDRNDPITVQNPAPRTRPNASPSRLEVSFGSSSSCEITASAYGKL